MTHGSVDVLEPVQGRRSLGLACHEEPGLGVGAPICPAHRCEWLEDSSVLALLSVSVVVGDFRTLDVGGERSVLCHQDPLGFGWDMNPAREDFPRWIVILY